jgi:hypothetical protein
MINQKRLSQDKKIFDFRKKICRKSNTISHHASMSMITKDKQNKEKAK